MASGMTVSDATDPLVELLAHLERDGEVPSEWVALHAPDGSLSRAWEATTDAHSLVLAAMRVQGATTTALAICAAARTELAGVPASPLRTRLEAVITIAEAWVHDPSLQEAVGEAFGFFDPQKVWMDDVHRLGMGVATLVHLVLAVDVGEVTPADAATALIESDDGPLLIEAAGSMLPSLRVVLPCPTLEQLREAYDGA